MLTGAGLAQALADGMGFSTVSSVMLAWGNAIADEINDNAIIIPPPAPDPGPISGLDGSRIASAFSAATGLTPPSTEVIAFCSSIASHIMTFGLETAGIISGLNGPVLAAAIHSAAGYPGSASGELISFCTALTVTVMADTVLIPH